MIVFNAGQKVLVIGKSDKPWLPAPGREATVVATGGDWAWLRFLPQEQPKPEAA